jgi:hypothetical protein
LGGIGSNIVKNLLTINAVRHMNIHEDVKSNTEFFPHDQYELLNQGWTVYHKWKRQQNMAGTNHQNRFRFAIGL